MSQVNPYGSIQKLTFENTLLYHLETEWGLLGGRRILQLLVVWTTSWPCWPSSTRRRRTWHSGTLIWTRRRGTESKARKKDRRV